MGAVGGGAIASTPAAMPGIRKRTQEKVGGTSGYNIRRTEIPKRFTVQDAFSKVVGTIVKEQGVWIIRMEGAEPQKFSYPESVKKYVASL
jgi:hypothetical protein